MRGALLFRITGVVLALLATGGSASKQNVVRVQVMSKVSEDLGVYWVNSWKGGELVRQKEEAVVPSGSLSVDSYRGHSFLVIDESKVSGLTHYTPQVWNPEHMVFFTMGEFDLQIYVSRDIHGRLYHEEESALTRTQELMTEATAKCLKDPEVVKAAAKLKGLAAAEGSCAIKPSGESEDPMSAEFKDCLSKAVAENLAKKESEAEKTMRMLQIVGDRTRNYTCADPEMETSNTTLPPISWTDPEGGRMYNAQVFLDEPSAKIMLLDDFASEEECKALMERATPHLRDATVNGGAGKSTLSQARRAKAGGVSADLHNNASVTAPLYRRGYGFANHVTGYNMGMEGQESFSVIKYGSEDQYLSHCDGDCTGSPLKEGGRIATMVIYCEQATVGGGTTFSSSDVFINGKKGQAAFFSYLGPDNRTDVGRTRHSGCPILKGTKWIATLWMRRGVSAEKGWEYFDPSGDPSDFARRQTTTGKSADEQTQGEEGDGSLKGKVTAAMAASTTAKQSNGDGDAKSIESSAAAAAAAAAALEQNQEHGTASGMGAEGSQDEGVLSGLAGWFSSKK